MLLLIGTYSLTAIPACVFEYNSEVFFVPYIWDVVVGTLTTTTMEWSRNKIQVFPLNEVEVVEPLPPSSNDTESIVSGGTDTHTHAHDNTDDVV